jgi:hypothetical protein
MTRAATTVGYLSHGVAQRALAAARDDQTGPSSSELERDRTPDPFPTAGDQSDLTLEPAPQRHGQALLAH